MKKLILIGILAWGTIASANTISVEFQKCSDNPDNLCALVYQDLTAKRSYNQEEMVVFDDPILTESQARKIQKKIWGMIEKVGRTFAVNIEGKIVSVKRIGGGKYNKLIMRGFSTSSAPRPRG